MEITVYRDQPLSRHTSSLPADIYNLARALQARSPGGLAFVPIRSMQVLAILDDEEFVFLDSQHKTWAMLAWRQFRADQRASLEEPVSFDVVCYEPEATEAMKRLLREFHLAVQALASKERIDGPARVLKFEARRRPESSEN